MDAVECMGLFRSAVSDFRADLSAVYNLVFRTLCDRNYFGGIFALLDVRRRKASVSRFISGESEQRLKWILKFDKIKPERILIDF